jgi:hypothetical protein
MKYFNIPAYLKQAKTLLLQLADFRCDDKIAAAVTGVFETTLWRGGRPFLPPVLRLLHHHPLERAVGEKKSLALTLRFLA